MFILAPVSTQTVQYDQHVSRAAAPRASIVHVLRHSTECRSPLFESCLVISPLA